MLFYLEHGSPSPLRIESRLCRHRAVVAEGSAGAGLEAMALSPAVPAVVQEAMAMSCRARAINLGKVYTLEVRQDSVAHAQDEAAQKLAALHMHAGVHKEEAA